jgi:hypothetical protein
MMIRLMIDQFAGSFSRAGSRFETAREAGSKGAKQAGDNL